MKTPNQPYINFGCLMFSSAITTFTLLLSTSDEIAAFRSTPFKTLSSTYQFYRWKVSTDVTSCKVAARNKDTIDSLFGPRVDDGEDEVLFSDNDADGDHEDWGVPTVDFSGELTQKKKSMSRWDKLNPKIKARIVQEAQERAIRNKKKREPAEEKKRRLYTQYKKLEIKSTRQQKAENFITRNTPLTHPSRTKLSDLTPGDCHKGKVISLTNFGAYIDINTEVDGLLHVSQITRDEFVDHPRNFLTPGEEVEVRVVRASEELKRLQLTMLPDEILAEEKVLDKSNDNDDDTPFEDTRIQLDEIEIDDELWGVIRRVTDYGAYVELGAVVRGFLHFMDHPMFGEVKGARPYEFMSVGDRIRVWIMDVDEGQRRIKLTANRPEGLPGPRREIRWI